MTKTEKLELYAGARLASNELALAMNHLFNVKVISQRFAGKAELFHSFGNGRTVTLDEIGQAMSSIKSELMDVSAGAMIDAQLTGDDKEEDGCVLPLDRPDPAA